MDFFDVSNTFFTIWDYPMSYLEFFGTLLNIAAVWLVARNKILTWPVGIVAVVLFGLLFYQVQLYSDVLEQIFYLTTGIWGWMVWSKRGKAKDKNKAHIVHNSYRENVISILAIGIGTLILGYFISNIHDYFPTVFSKPAAFPYLDAFTTVMSFTAQVLMIFRRLESWMIWIVVDVIGVFLYYARGVKMVAVLYFIFLILATKGYFNWRKEMRGYKTDKKVGDEVAGKELSWKTER